MHDFPKVIYKADSYLAIHHRHVRLVINAVCFYAGSVVALVFGNLWAVGFAIFYFFIHLFLVNQNKSEWFYILAIVLIGTLVDSLWGVFSIIDYNWEYFFAPPWLICMWFFFSSTLCHSLNWLKKNLWVAAICAAIAGPFSYYVGAQINEAELGKPLWLVLVVLSCFWGLFFPLALRASEKVVYENQI